MVGPLVLLLASLSLGLGKARGAEPSRSNAPAASPPIAARALHREVAASAYRVFGPGAPVSVLAAQLHQESGWNARARSGVGAQGLAQFMPATAADMARLHPAECAPANPYDASWAIRCQHRYMRSLLDALTAEPGTPTFTRCSAWAFGLSAYNGGLGWVARDRRQAAHLHRDPNQWFGSVDATPDPRRRPQYVAENRGYPRRILLTLTPLYAAWGWGSGVC